MHGGLFMVFDRALACFIVLYETLIYSDDKSPLFLFRGSFLKDLKYSKY